jgi:putative heme-binding domain-containing protein
VGRTRNPVYLRESLIAPGADIARGFDAVTVVTKDGKTLRGIERALDDFSVVMQDFSGKVYSFDRADVRSVTRANESLMPAATKTLSQTELNDVLAYLVTLHAARNPEVRER